MVIKRNAIEIKRIIPATNRHCAHDLGFTERLANHFLRKLNRRERAQTKEVHLEKTDLLACWSIPLRHALRNRLRGRFFSSTNSSAQRNDVIKRTRGDNHTRCMHALIARMIFKPTRMIEDASDARITRNQPRNLRLFRNRFFDRDVEFSRHQIRKHLPFCCRETHHARDILNCGLRFQATKGDDLRDMAVLLAHIVDDGRATILANIDVDIGILRAIGIGETLEEQAVFFRARVAETEHIARHRANARTTRRCGNAALTRPVHEVPHDEEVRAD